jgi:phage gp36-like protein
MAYCTSNDMKLLLPETMLISLSNDTQGATEINSTNVAEAIDQADREIDSYLVIAGESVPMDPVPPLVANLSAKMAIWNLHLRKYFDSEIWRKTYERCLKLLERIAEGKMSIGQEVTGETLPASAGIVVETRTQKFTSTQWETF